MKQLLEDSQSNRFYLDNGLGITDFKIVDRFAISKSKFHLTSISSKIHSHLSFIQSKLSCQFFYRKLIAKQPKVQKKLMILSPKIWSQRAYILMIANVYKIYRYIAMEFFDDHRLEEISINYLL